MGRFERKGEILVEVDAFRVGKEGRRKRFYFAAKHLSVNSIRVSVLQFFSQFTKFSEEGTVGRPGSGLREI